MITKVNFFKLKLIILKTSTLTEKQPEQNSVSSSLANTAADQI